MLQQRQPKKRKNLLQWLQIDENLSDTMTKRKILKIFPFRLCFPRNSSFILRFSPIFPLLYFLHSSLSLSYFFSVTLLSSNCFLLEQKNPPHTLQLQNFSSNDLKFPPCLQLVNNVFHELAI